MQLHALLSSFFATKIGDCEIVVIYKCSSEAHKHAYMEVVDIFGERVRFIEQDKYAGFKDCMEQTLLSLSKGKLFFLVDDIVFTEVVDYHFLASLNLSDTVFSLRMGEHLDYSYVVNSGQPLPRGLAVEDGYLRWKWQEGKLDWGYPLSVDGHIFSSAEVLLWVKFFEFSSPSSFENAIQKLKDVYSGKMGMSFRKSRIVNIPANKVQHEVDNLHGKIHQDDLLQQWCEGKAIDHARFRGWVNHSVHEEAEFQLVRREVK
jgi:hypothetical protein